MANQLNIEYSQNLPDILQITKQAFEKEARMAMAAKLFELKRISSGMAAELASINHQCFCFRHFAHPAKALLFQDQSWEH